MQRSFLGRHYALAVVAIIFVALLAAAGLRSTPGVLMVPWEQAFGWSREQISFAAATGIFLFGLTGPFAAAAMQGSRHSLKSRDDILAAMEGHLTGNKAAPALWLMLAAGISVISNAETGADRSS